ncbi:MAG: hypothetical protein IPM59_12205 [Chloracidobacterium sp.]|nr:hypothetical protein [Chloracidobacterium sp.]
MKSMLLLLTIVVGSAYSSTAGALGFPAGDPTNSNSIESAAITDWSAWFTDGDIEYRYEVGLNKMLWVEWINHGEKAVRSFTMTITLDDFEGERSTAKQQVLDYTSAGGKGRTVIAKNYRVEVVRIAISEIKYAE